MEQTDQFDRASTKSAIVGALDDIRRFFAENEKEILEFARLLDQFMRSIPGINVLAGEGLEPFIRSRTQLARDAGIDDIAGRARCPMRRPARASR